MPKPSDIDRGITIAVLPFENLTKEGDLHLFCEAFIVDLITELSRFHQFQIIAYKSSAHISTGVVEDPEPMKSLKADYIVSGTFHNSDAKMCITARLINCHNDILVWAERFEGRLENISAIRDDLLLKIVFSLQQQVDHDLLTYIRHRTQSDIKAYSYWLNGLAEIKKGNIDADNSARKYFQEAMEIDPHFALAYTGMSLTYFNEWSCQLWDRWEVSQNGAFEWAAKAMELDKRDYLSTTIMGKVYLYRGDYDKAEHYFRRAHFLNPNDADNLILIAYGLVYLGYPDEAFQLYEKAGQLNPFGRDLYFACGAFILFEMGKFKEAIELASKNHSGEHYVDFMAYLSAGYYAIGDFRRMEECWEKYLREYAIKINKGEPADPSKALQWMIDVNPYKGFTHLQPFWDYMRGGESHPMQDIPLKPSHMQSKNLFHQKGDFWHISFEGKSVQIADLKGLQDLEKVLVQPHSPIHCTALMGAALSERGEVVFDEKAKSNFQRRILELQQDLAEAEEFNNSIRMAELQDEYDQLLSHLSRSVGLGHKTRKIASGTEKARTAVTWRIRHAIKKIAEVHPKLAKHLEISVKTGLFCSYSPENEITWMV